MYIDKPIENIIEENMMTFSQYVIKNRALPDLYSGMKPIHLKILWSMYENKTFNFTKSANVSGKVMVYSPHGDCYETIVNMVQKDRHKYNLIEGEGNWGSSCSTDVHFGSSRYTECKLSQIALDCLQGISKNMVEMIDNYDNTKKMPKFLPTRFPLLLCMASNGIAVGMANNSPSFSLEEVCNATIDYLQDKEIPILIPDFATGGYIIKDMKELENINKIGRGTVKLRSKYHIEDNCIIIDEIPYGTKVNVEVIIDKIIELCKDGKLKEVTNILNLTGLNGLSIEITCKKGTNMDLLMEKLYKLTPLESNFSANMNVLVDGHPMVLGVHDTIKEWVKFRKSCVINGLNYDISKLTSELHILHGLEKVLLDIDKAISIIRHSNSIENDLINYFKIDKTQADNIVNMKLRNINKDYIIKKISDIKEMELELQRLKATVNDENEIKNIIISDLKDVINKFKQPRRTQIINPKELQEISADQLIEQYNCKLIYTRDSYIKKLLKSSDQQKLKDNDEIIGEISSTNKSTLLFFTNKQNRYRLPCHQLDTCTPSALGTYIPNILNLEPNEQVIKVFSIDEERGYILSVFANGKLSKIDIKSYMSNYTKLNNCYSNDSELIDINYIEKDVDVLLLTEEGKMLIIDSSQVNSKGSRSSQGNTAINTESKVIAAIIDVNKDMNFNIKTEKGKEISFYLDDVAPTGKNTEERTLYTYCYGNVRNKGNYIYYNKADKIISFTLNK